LDLSFEKFEIKIVKHICFKNEYCKINRLVISEEIDYLRDSHMKFKIIDLKKINEGKEVSYLLKNIYLDLIFDSKLL
jgi:hypothetical protein